MQPGRASPLYHETTLPACQLNNGARPDHQQRDAPHAGRDPVHTSAQVACSRPQQPDDLRDESASRWGAGCALPAQPAALLGCSSAGRSCRARTGVGGAVRAPSSRVRAAFLRPGRRRRGRASQGRPGQVGASLGGTAWPPPGVLLGARRAPGSSPPRHRPSTAALAPRLQGALHRLICRQRGALRQQLRPAAAPHLQGELRWPPPAQPAVAPRPRVPRPPGRGRWPAAALQHLAAPSAAGPRPVCWWQVGEREVIQGWDEGILGSQDMPAMKEGGKRRLVLPPGGRPSPLACASTVQRCSARPASCTAPATGGSQCSWATTVIRPAYEAARRCLLPAICDRANAPRADPDLAEDANPRRRCWLRAAQLRLGPH
jgi:hypothetical protein